MPANPELSARYDAAILKYEVTLKANDTDAALVFARTAAEVFLGSSDPEQLEKRHTALLHIAGIHRSLRQFAEAEQAYAHAAEVVAKESGTASRAYILGRYYTGLMRQRQENDAAAIEPLREAHEAFAAIPGCEVETRLTGATLGLSCLREQRWEDCAAVLTRISNPAKVDNDEASIQHNLGMALHRSGKAREAEGPIRTALAIHEKVNGRDHPITVETMLLAGTILADSGKAGDSVAMIRNGAAVILSGAGESHPFFSRALLAMARNFAYLGDGAAAEALTRRANFILDQCNVTGRVREGYDLDVRDIPAMWRTGKAASGPGDIRLWRVDFQHTLRRYQASALDYAGSGEMPKTWYFFVPGVLDAGNRTDVMHVVRIALADANRRLNAREPADANFLDVTSAAATDLSPADLAALPPRDLFPQRTWEDATAFSLVRGRLSSALPQGDFALAVHAFATLRGAPLPLGPWEDIGFREEDFDRVKQDPSRLLAELVRL